MTIIVDDLISLEKLEAEHAAEIFDMASRNKLYLREFLPWIDHADSIQFFENFISDSLSRYILEIEYPFVIKYENIIIGRIGLYNVDQKNKIAEIGYWIDEKMQGNGVISKSCKSIVDYAFSTLNLNRIEIKCAVENSRSNAIPERIGFSHEGILRQAGIIRGKFHDLHLYSICKSDII